MPKNSTTKIVFGIVLLQSLACSAEIACGGLFLSNDYSLHVGEHRFFASAEYARYGVSYDDDWVLKAGSRGFPTEHGEGDFAWTLGFESSYRFLTFGATVGSSIDAGRSLPTVSANMVLHTADSMFYAGAGMARINKDLATVDWHYKEDVDLVPDISAKWETSLLKKDFATGFKVRDKKGREHRLDLSASIITSTPFNQESEYFIRDSLSILTLGANYRWNGLNVSYNYVDADGRLYGIRRQDDDTKRFMYAPFSGNLHLADLTYETPLPSLDINAIAAYGQAQLHKDKSRFHETLAPNRALQNSVIQALSFSFMQQSYRVQANADGGLGLVGAAYHKTIGNVEPRISGNLYYAQGTADAELTSERTQFISTIKETENHKWEAKSFGAIAGLGFKLNYGHLRADANVYQLVPVYTDYGEVKEKTASKPSSGSTPSKNPESTTKPETSSPKNEKFNYTFGNGMICTLNVGFDF